MSEQASDAGELAGDTTVELYGPEDGGWYTTRVHDWIALCPGLRDADVRGYNILRALVIEKYKNPVRKLTLVVLCDLIPGPNGKPSSLTRVRGILAGLSSAGLISTPEGGPVKTSSRPSAAQRSMRIRINDMPVEGYRGWRNAEAKLAFIGKGQSLATPSEAGRNSDPGDGEGGSGEAVGRNSDPAGCNSDPGGSNSDPDPGADLPKPEAPLVPILGTATDGDALSARSAGERRRQTTGSRGEREGGSAASGKTSPPLPQAQRQTVQAVRDLLPADLNRALGDKTPVNIQAGIIAALAAGTPRERTVEQLVRYRLMPRWERYWAVRFYAGELTPKMPSGRLKEPFGPLAQMLADTPECGNLSCENRHDFVTEAACQQCEMRKVDRRADRAKEHQNGGQGAVPQSEAPALPMPSPRASQAAWWDCKMCPASAKGDPPVDGICRRCREKAAAAVAWTDPDAVTGEEPAAGPSAADLAAAAAEEQRLAEEADLDARLRAEQAARYGTPEQQAMYATTAPF